MNEATEYVEKENRIARATERFGAALETYAREVEILQAKVTLETEWKEYQRVLAEIADREERLVEQARSCASLAVWGLTKNPILKNPMRGCTASEALRRKP